MASSTWEKNFRAALRKYPKAAGAFMRCEERLKTSLFGESEIQTVLIFLEAYARGTRGKVSRRNEIFLSPKQVRELQRTVKRVKALISTVNDKTPAKVILEVLRKLTAEAKDPARSLAIAALELEKGLELYSRMVTCAADFVDQVVPDTRVAATAQIAALHQLLKARGCRVTAREFTELVWAAIDATSDGRKTYPSEEALMRRVARNRRSYPANKLYVARTWEKIIAGFSTTEINPK